MRGNDEKVVEIEIERLHDFKNHPFKVQADSQMKELQDSISKYGILNILIVRPRPEGFYEVISGHRRKYAAMELKYTKVPVIIRYMLDEEAIISMVDSNLQTLRGKSLSGRILSQTECCTGHIRRSRKRK